MFGLDIKKYLEYSTWFAIHSSIILNDRVLSTIDSAYVLPIIEHMKHRNPVPTVDIIIEIAGKIVLIKRKNPPSGWAIPGGFIDYGESAEAAARREAKEETGLDITGLKQFHTYSEPERDPRQHTLSVVFVAKARGRPKACDDAADIGLFTRDSLPNKLAFDHGQILDDYYSRKY